MSESKFPIAVIGGSGVYQFAGLENAEERAIETPFGDPSDTILTGKLNRRNVAFLPRHGRHHTIAPPRIPFRANIWALKSLGARWIISLSAVGSLKENLKPRDFVIPLQFFDRTKNSLHHSFFEEGIVAHVGFSDPVCHRLASILYQSSSSAGATVHWGGTYVNMEGPAFSTRAESEFHRQMGFDVVGMTNLAEAKLAREAEISYATLAMVTDYDCWHDGEGEVSVPDVVQILKDNAALAKDTVTRAIGSISSEEKTSCHQALENGLITPREHWRDKDIDQLRPILSRFL